MPAPKPSISSVILIALMGATAAIAALLVANASASLASPTNSFPVWFALIQGLLCVVGAVGMLLRRSWGYWLATAGLLIIAVSKSLIIFREGFQWNASIGILVSLFLALEAVARVLGWLEDDDAPHVEGKTMVHDYLNASMSAKHYLDRMVEESPRQAVSNLTLALKSKKDQVRSLAARMLAALGTASALQRSLKALASENRDERVRCIDLMAPDFFEEVDRLQDEALADEPGLDTLLNLYLLEHADLFSDTAA